MGQEFQVDIGRRYGHTGEDGVLHFNQDLKIIPYGSEENVVLAYRQVRKKGNESKSSVKVLGIVSRNDYTMIEHGISVPKSKVTRLKGFDDRQAVERIIREEFGKTEESMEF